MEKRDSQGNLQDMYDTAFSIMNLISSFGLIHDRWSEAKNVTYDDLENLLKYVKDIKDDYFKYFKLTSKHTKEAGTLRHNVETNLDELQIKIEDLQEGNGDDND